MSDPDRLVTITLPANRALKIAAGMYGCECDFRVMAREDNVPADVLILRAEQCRHLARLFDEACSQPELPGTESETALGKL